MSALFQSRDTLTAARLGRSRPDALTCAICKSTSFEAADMADAHYDEPALAEAQTHYGGAICSMCFEDLSTCAYCGKRRLERDMWSISEPLVCSMTCDTNLDME